MDEQLLPSIRLVIQESIHKEVVSGLCFECNDRENKLKIVELQARELSTVVEARVSCCIL
jgi:hypothetical protein